jgi:murein DD-endopeptidase MepM/ murein hydrolase activator NlpD
MKLWFCICLVCLPLKKLEVTSPFGYRLHPLSGKYSCHEGVDLRARSDTVYAVLNGKVIMAGYDDRLGIFIRLDHRAFQSSYGHLSSVFVIKDDSVYSGQALGITGATGRVTGEHLHFSIHCSRGYLNPLEFLYELLTDQQHE